MSTKQKGSVMPRLAKQLLILVGITLLCATYASAKEMSTPARLAVSSLMMDVTRSDGHLVAVGERGHILVSSDDGQSWQQQQNVPTRALLTGVFFLDDQRGWAVGHDQTILATTDGGQSWQVQHEDTSDDLPLFDIWFADADHGFAVGAYALYLTTEDGGLSWHSESFSPRFEEEPLEESTEENVEEDADAEVGYEDAESDYEEDIPFDYHLNRLARAADGTLYLAAEAGYMFRSKDGGESWISLPSSYEGSYFGVIALTGDTVLIYGLRGHLFRSEDAGQSWVEINTGTRALLSGATQLTDGTVVVVGLGGTVLVSRDEGLSFTLWRQEDSRALSSLIEVAPGKIVAGSEIGLKSLDVADFLAGTATGQLDNPNAQRNQ